MIRPGTRTIRRTPYSAPTAPALWCPGTGCRTICIFPFPGWERKGAASSWEGLSASGMAENGLPGLFRGRRSGRRRGQRGRAERPLPPDRFPEKRRKKGRSLGGDGGDRRDPRPHLWSQQAGQIGSQKRRLEPLSLGPPGVRRRGARPDPPGAGKRCLPAGTGIFWWTATTSFLPGRSFGSWRSGTWTAPAACCRISCATIRARRAVR